MESRLFNASGRCKVSSENSVMCGDGAEFGELAWPLMGLPLGVLCIDLVFVLKAEQFRAIN